MEETSEELPNFSTGIDLSGPYSISNKNEAEKKLASCTFRKCVGRPAAANFGRKTVTWNKKVTNWSLITLNVKFPLLLLVLNLFNLGNKVHSC